MNADTKTKEFILNLAQWIKDTRELSSGINTDIGMTMPYHKGTADGALEGAAGSARLAGWDELALAFVDEEDPVAAVKQVLGL